MEPIAVGSLIVLLIWGVASTLAIIKWGRTFIVQQKQFLRNVKIASRNYSSSNLQSEHSSMKTQQSNYKMKHHRQLVNDSMAQFVMTQRGLLFRFYMLRCLSRYSEIAFAVIMIRYQFPFPFTWLTHIVSVLTTLITYGFVGTMLAKSQIGSFYAPFFILVMFIAACNTCLCHFGSLDRRTLLQEFQCLMTDLTSNIQYIASLFPKQSSVNRNLEGEFAIELQNNINVQFAFTQHMLNRRKKVQSITISWMFVSGVLMSTQISSITNPWMIYGLLLGALVEQAVRLVIAMIIAVISVGRYHSLSDPEVMREINSFYNKQSAKTSQVNSPVKKPQIIQDRNSPLKYLIQQEANISAERLRIQHVEPKYSQQDQSIFQDTHQKIQEDNNNSVAKKIDASHWEDMNSGDNLIPIHSERRDLNEFNLDELKERDFPVKQVDIGDQPQIKKVSSNRRTQLEPLGENSAKKLPFAKLPPVNFKRAPILTKENQIPHDSLQELKQLNDQHNYMIDQKALKEIENLDKDYPLDKKNTQGSFRKSVYKTSMEEEEVNFQESRKLQVRSSAAQRYEEVFPISETINLANILSHSSQSKTIEQRSERSMKRGRAESLHTDRKKVKISRRNEAHSVELENQFEHSGQQKQYLEGQKHQDDLTTKRQPVPRKRTRKMKELAKIYDTNATKIIIQPKKIVDHDQL